ncbi:hypothetical protein [Allobranchiibius sp. GilTou38]|uniref:hypothetical protein n=1 Tax=Allobranchiibius sp. GilTou38 TaxID=2815210 RepID=UPI001AA159F3|nr:hypothetical protein [Allobranchiibius sp. GilTou38]MBO1768261.1 hypothetical protein [Allobranchiibius sp. GilTou38]
MRAARTSVAIAAAISTLAVAGCADKATKTPVTVTVTPSHAPPSLTSSSSTPTIPTTTLPSGRAGTPRGGAPELGGVNQKDASAVAAAVMRVFATQDTAIDTTTLDAERRAEPLLGAPLAAAVTAPLSGNGGGGAAWTVLTAHHGWTTAAAKAVPMTDVPDQTGDSPTLAVRQIDVTTTGHGVGNWTSKATTAVWIVTCRRTSATGPWRVTQVYDQTP